MSSSPTRLEDDGNGEDEDDPEVLVVAETIETSRAAPSAPIAEKAGSCRGCPAAAMPLCKSSTCSIGKNEHERRRSNTSQISNVPVQAEVRATMLRRHLVLRRLGSLGMAMRRWTKATLAVIMVAQERFTAGAYDHQLPRLPNAVISISKHDNRENMVRADLLQTCRDEERKVKSQLAECRKRLAVEKNRADRLEANRSNEQLAARQLELQVTQLQQRLQLQSSRKKVPLPTQPWQAEKWFKPGPPVPIVKDRFQPPPVLPTDVTQRQALSSDGQLPAPQSTISGGTPEGSQRFSYQHTHSTPSPNSANPHVSNHCLEVTQPASATESSESIRRTALLSSCVDHDGGSCNPLAETGSSPKPMAKCMANLKDHGHETALLNCSERGRSQSLCDVEVDAKAARLAAARARAALVLRESAT